MRGAVEADLFSMIRGRGGNQDNPDPQQFKETFKYVVADKLFVQSSSSNCKVNGDKILLDISAVAMVRYEKLEPPTQVAQLPDLDILMVIKPPLSLPTQNVLAYLAGYLLKKISVNACIEC